MNIVFFERIIYHMFFLIKYNELKFFFFIAKYFNYDVVNRLLLVELKLGTHSLHMSCLFETLNFLSCELDVMNNIMS